MRVMFAVMVGLLGLVGGESEAHEPEPCQRWLADAPDRGGTDADDDARRIAQVRAVSCIRHPDCEPTQEDIRVLKRYCAPSYGIAQLAAEHCLAIDMPMDDLPLCDSPCVRLGMDEITSQQNRRSP